MTGVNARQILAAARRHSHWIALALALLMFGASLWGPVSADHRGANLHTMQANAWLEGTTRIDPQWILDARGDWSIFGGYLYVAFPPAPTLLLLPVVKLFGYEHTNTTAIAVLLILVAVWALNGALARLGVERPARVWTLLAFVGGTGVWFVLLNSRFVWHFSHAVALACTALCLAEALGKRRGALLGLWLAGAMLSRQLGLFLIVPVLFLTDGFRDARTRAFKRADIAAFIAVLALCLGAFALYNYARFGSLFESGYAYMAENGFLETRRALYGRFSAAYVPFNLYYLLVHGVNLAWDKQLAYLAHLKVDPFGTGLLAASPFLLAGFAAKLERRVAWGLGLGIALTLGTQMFYLGNGSAQVNTQRFALDAMPHMVILLGAGLQQRWREFDGRLWRLSILYAIALNAVLLAGFDGLNRALLFWLRLNGAAP